MNKQTKTKIGVGSVVKAKVGELEKITREGRSRRMRKNVVVCVQSVVGKTEFLVLFDKPTFQLLAKWTKLKATLADAGPDGSCYQDYKSSSALELRKHMGLYIFNGLSPSPRVQNKFYPQCQDEVHGNDFVYNSFGPNSERRHRHFKTFLSCQNPAIDTPSRSMYPNWKMRPILKWMNFIFREACMLGISF